LGQDFSRLNNTSRAVVERYQKTIRHFSVNQVLVNLSGMEQASPILQDVSGERLQCYLAISNRQRSAIGQHVVVEKRKHASSHRVATDS
jgi:hypothetical protein